MYVKVPYKPKRNVYIFVIITMGQREDEVSVNSNIKTNSRVLEWLTTLYDSPSSPGVGF